VGYKVLGLPHDTPIRSFPSDARKVVDELAADTRYDLIVGDAFNDLSVPFHLTTLEFNQKIARHLAADGMYLINLIDDWEFGRLLGAYVLTLKKTFKHVYVFCTKEGGVEDGRDTFVIAAVMKPIEVSGWGPGHETDFPGSLLTDEHIEELQGKCRGRILTDDNAPVENLLEPVVRNRN
jgi:spermidine synthase